MPAVPRGCALGVDVKSRLEEIVSRGLSLTLWSVERGRHVSVGFWIADRYDDITSAANDFSESNRSLVNNHVVSPSKAVIRSRFLARPV